LPWWYTILKPSPVSGGEGRLSSGTSRRYSGPISLPAVFVFSSWEQVFLTCLTDCLHGYSGAFFKIVYTLVCPPNGRFSSSPKLR
jgi:hypothetical protein